MFLRRRRSNPSAVPADPRINPIYSRDDEWWESVAGRPRHLTNYPDRFGFDRAEDHGRALDEYEFEPVLFLAREGYLSEAEIEELRARAAESAARISTPREEMQSPSISKDRSRVRLAQAVDAELGEPTGSTYDVGVPYS